MHKHLGRFHMLQSKSAGRPHLPSLRVAVAEDYRLQAPKAAANVLLGCGYETRSPQRRRSATREGTAMSSPCTATRNQPLLSTTRECPCAATEDPVQLKTNKLVYIAASTCQNTFFFYITVFISFSLCCSRVQIENPFRSISVSLKQILSKF